MRKYKKSKEDASSSSSYSGDEKTSKATIKIEKTKIQELYRKDEEDLNFF